MYFNINNLRTDRIVLQKSERRDKRGATVKNRNAPILFCRSFRAYLLMMLTFSVDMPVVS